MQRQQKAIIEYYIISYNNFDIQGMIRDLAPNIVFENISDGQVTLRTEGIDDFKAQAESAKQLFHNRKQTIEYWEFNTTIVKIGIAYQGTLAVDLPNGLKAGDTLEMQGTSHFEFVNDKITRITDIS